jgi:hypothetical protein
VPRFATSARSGLAAAGRALADAVARARAGASGRLDLTDRLGQGWPTGAMALWVAVLLAVMLLFGIGRA